MRLSEGRLVATLTALICVSAPARAQTLVTGVPPSPVNVKDFVIDGTTGKVDAPKSRFPRGQAVRIVIKNVNPFLYQYEIETADEQAVFEPSPLTFFNFAFGAGIPEKGLGLLATGGPVDYLNGRAVAQIGQCPAIISDQNVAPSRDSVRLKLGRSVNAVGSILERLARLHTVADSLRGKFESAMLTTREPDAPTSVVAASADVARIALGAFVDSLRESSVTVDSDLKRAVQFNGEAERFVGDFPTGYAAACPIIGNIAKALADSLPGLKKTHEALRKTRDDAYAAHSAFTVTVKDPAAYYAMLILKRYDSPTHVTVNVRRKIVTPAVGSTSWSVAPSSSPEAATPRPPTPATAGNVTVTTTTVVPQPGNTNAASPATNAGTGATTGSQSAVKSQLLASNRLHFGGQGRFSITAGLMFSALDDPRYSTNQRRINPVPGQSQDTSEFVVAVSDSGEFRLLPMIALNMLAVPFGATGANGLHLSFGTGLQTTRQSASLGYFVGAGLSLFDSRFLLTAGSYAGRVQQLGDLRIGQRVSSATLPSRDRWGADWAFGLTFRLY